MRLHNIASEHPSPSEIGRLRRLVVRRMVASGVWSFGDWSFGEWTVYRYKLYQTKGAHVSSIILFYFATGCKVEDNFCLFSLYSLSFWSGFQQNLN
jgi:hypothetical protein